MHRIFVVEDDAIIAREIKNYLESWGYTVGCVSDFSAVCSEFASFDPQLVLLDISLPFFNGYYWCGEIRKLSKVPIIFISSSSENMNIVTAINMGGDDFISKPFDLSVLNAKVLALLRRSYDFSAQTGLLEYRGAVLNTADASLSYKGDKIELSKNEYRILLTLMEQKGQTVSRSGLMTKLWETDSYVDENTLTVNITRLRKKLESAGLNDFITTKKGLGYLIN